jgi:hypothetical protein
VGKMAACIAELEKYGRVARGDAVQIVQDLFGQEKLERPSLDADGDLAFDSCPVNRTQLKRILSALKQDKRYENAAKAKAAEEKERAGLEKEH